jgi:hypothetical protein
LSFNESLQSFGEHPDFEAGYKSLRRHLRKKKNPFYLGIQKTLENFQGPNDSEVYLIPRNLPYFVIDEWGGPALPIIHFPFSSFNFCIDDDEDESGVFFQMIRNRYFSRLGGISQLGYLVPARPESLDQNTSIVYTSPTFLHTRLTHCLITAILMELVLAKNRFNKKQRFPIVLTAGFHDIAIPAGGDPVKNIDPEELDEEKNFSLVLKESDLIKKWQKDFNFNLKQAQKWVENEGVFGLLLDVLDKISYTTLDCYALGRERSGRIRDFCLKHPFVSDIWQDIEFTKDKTKFGFKSKERLYDFLTLRALEHIELLFNPESRKLDLLLAKEIKPLYKKNVITKEQLLSIDNSMLEYYLRQIKPNAIKSFLEPDNMDWQKFKTKKEAKEFSLKIDKNKIERIEKIKPFNPGLHFPIILENDIKPLKDVLEPTKIKELESLAHERAGYYVFYYK